MPKCTAPGRATTRRSSPIWTSTGWAARARRLLPRRPRRLPHRSQLLRRRKAKEDADAMIRQLDDRTLVSGQIAPHEVAGLAGQHGVTVLVNNRPDFEEPGQPLAADVEAA